MRPTEVGEFHQQEAFPEITRRALALVVAVSYFCGGVRTTVTSTSIRDVWQDNLTFNCVRFVPFCVSLLQEDRLLQERKEAEKRCNIKMWAERRLQKVHGRTATTIAKREAHIRHKGVITHSDLHTEYGHGIGGKNE